MSDTPDQGHNQNDEHDWMAHHGADLRDLIMRMRAVGVAELELEQGTTRLRLRRGKPVEGAGLPVDTKELEPTPLPQPQTVPVAGSVPAPERAPLSLPPAPVLMIAELEELQERHYPITAPLVGTFFLTPAPDKPPLVEEGMLVKVGQPVGVIEAMKMFNEIQSDVEGVVVAIMVENGQPVEYGQPLIVVEIAE